MPSALLSFAIIQKRITWFHLFWINPVCCLRNVCHRQNFSRIGPFGLHAKHDRPIIFFHERFIAPTIIDLYRADLCTLRIPTIRVNNSCILRSSTLRFFLREVVREKFPQIPSDLVEKVTLFFPGSHHDTLLCNMVSRLLAHILSLRWCVTEWFVLMWLASILVLYYTNSSALWNHFWFVDFFTRHRMSIRWVIVFFSDIFLNELCIVIYPRRAYVFQH